MQLGNLLAAKALAVLLLASLHTPANAVLLSGFGYQHDTNNNYVSGLTLDWLRWDYTDSRTVYDVKNDPLLSGWRLATNAEVAALFGDFGFGSFDSDPLTSEGSSISWSAGETEPSNIFQDMFGVNTILSVFYPETLSFAGAVFGEGVNVGGTLMYNVAEVIDDFSVCTGLSCSDQLLENGSVSIQDLTFDAVTTNSNFGVALVRSNTFVASVPEPSSLLSMSLLLPIMFIRHFSLKKRHPAS